MSCSVKTGLNLYTAAAILASTAGNLATALYAVSNDKFALTGIFQDKAGSGQLRTFNLYQTTTGGVLATGALRVDLYADSTALGVASGALYDTTASNIIGIINIETTDWVTIDATQSMACKQLDLPVWAETNSTSLYGFLVNKEPVDLTSSTFSVLAAVANS